MLCLFWEMLCARMLVSARNVCVNSHDARIRSLSTLLATVLCFDFHVRTHLRLIELILSMTYKMVILLHVCASASLPCFAPGFSPNDFHQLELA